MSPDAMAPLLGRRWRPATGDNEFTVRCISDSSALSWRDS